MKKAEKDAKAVLMSAREVNDSAAKVTNVHHAMRIRIENREMLLQKVLNQLKKINLVVQNEVILMPVVQKRKMTGKNFSKTKSLTSARKDGHAESRKRSNRQNSHYKVMLEKKKI